VRSYLRLAAVIAAFWVFDALVHAVLLSDGTIIDQILRPPLPEIYSRCAVAFGLLCSILLYRSKIEKDAQLSRELDQFRSAESMYRTVFDQLGEGLAVRELVFDEEGNPVDYRYLDVNPAFEEITGLKREQVVGKTGRSLFPRLGEDLIERFVTVAMTGQIMRFEAFIEDLDKHFGYTVFSPGKMQFATLMIDVSERKRTESVLRQTAFFESCIAEVAKILVSKESEELSDVLEIVAGALNLSYCSVLELKHEKTISRIHEWSDQEGPVHTQQFRGFDLTRLGDWYDTLMSGQCILARDLSEHTKSALQEVKMLSEGGIKAFASVPILLQGRLIGLLSVGARKVHAWSANEIGLLVTISGILATYHRRVQAERRMEYLTYHDSLTRVHNRTYFESKLLAAIASKPVLSVIMGDLNGLKLINDRLGHAEGDRVIVTAAKALKAACREQDVVIRWGGDEFVMIMPGADEQDAANACSKILKNCRSLDNGIEVSISLGHATRTDTSVSIRELIKKAEDLMYLHKIRERRSSRHSLLSSLEHSLLELSQETKEHCDRIRELALAVGKELGMSQSELDELALLASLHDVGKIGIPSHILLKPDLLTPEEWRVVKKHPEIGHRIVRTISDLVVVAEGILHHHERWDGAGYPHGLKGEEIPLISRIIAIADAFDAMTNERHYRSARSVSSAMQELRRCSGSQFDPSLVPVFERVIGEITHARTELHAAGLDTNG
jgi:diguanylate cyclase (GGDEF)-like protein/PAS domain S-box-containing protein